MRKLFFLLLIAAVCTLSGQAVTVRNTAGQLSTLVSDTQITQLTVTGTMDARDFLFITEELTELTSIDLSAVSIVPLNSSKILYGTVTQYLENEIPRTAFFGKKLTTVALPTTIKSIGFAAFAGCYQLRSVTLPASLVDIGDYAFAGSALTSVNVPATVMFMGKGAFARCESLQSATVSAEEIGDFAFLGATHLSDVQLGATVSSIGKAAFSGCAALTTIQVASGSRLSRIDDEAFINSGLEQINIQNLPVGTVGDWAFAQTKLSNFTVGSSVSYLGEGALAHNPLLTNVRFNDMSNSSSTGNGNTAGPEYAQFGEDFRPFNPRLKAPGVRRSMERLYAYTFAGDEHLNAGNILRPGLKYIGDYAFYNVCQEMDTMRLPSSVTYLGNYAMAGMTGMQVLVTGAEEVPELGENVWAGVDQASVPLVTPTDESTELYKVADQWMNFFFDPGTPQYILGDVNRDGYVNLADVAALINYMLTGQGDIDMLAADVTKDGNVNVADMSQLISMLLTNNAMLSVPAIHQNAEEHFVGTTDALELPVVGMKAGETRTIDVALRNTQHSYTAVECELVLPEGLTLDAVEGIDRGAGHSFSQCRNEVEEDVYTIIGVSTALAKFEGENGNVMRLTVTANDDFDAQGAEIRITNVVLVTPSTEGFLADDALSRMHDGAGIEQVTADKEIATVRYINVAGQESDQPFDGMNIIVTTYTDGTTTTTKVVK